MAKNFRTSAPAKLSADGGLALRIDGVDLEHVLGQIEAYNDNLL